MQSSEILPLILNIQSDQEFRDLALQIFRHQSLNNQVYKNYLKAIKIAPAEINSLEKIPFLPISFFKTHDVMTGQFEPEIIFTSSGTTGSDTSRHFVRSCCIYEDTFLAGFEKFYGKTNQYSIFGLLPSYLERKGSSLITMTQKLIELSGREDSGFFLSDHQNLAKMIAENERRGNRSVLLGVTFALLDFAAAFPMELKHTIVMETGGMKGRREEITREEVADLLKDAFQMETVHSEYGMTELMSQAYSFGNGKFNCPSWMKVLVRDTSDPLDVRMAGAGALNIIDLANIDSCAFIATQDLGRSHPDGSFDVTGRFDHSDIRGCNLLIA